MNSRAEQLAVGWERMTGSVHPEQAKIFRLCAKQLRAAFDGSDFGLSRAAWVVVCQDCDHAPHEGEQCRKASNPENPTLCDCTSDKLAQMLASDEVLLAVLTEQVAEEVARALSAAKRGDDRQWRTLPRFMQCTIARGYLRDFAVSLPILLRHWRGLVSGEGWIDRVKAEENS